MAVSQPVEEFARMLGALEMQDFEDQVCGFLRRSMLDFQNVPAQPHGDGGLDGLSNGQSIAYCCYGPVQAPSKVKAKGLKADIVKKFRGDLMTLFELEAAGKGTAATSAYVHKTSAELATIIAQGNKIRTVRLVVSVFDSHQVLGPLNTSFNDFKTASQCNYVDKSASMTIWGPKELASVGTVDDLTLLRLQERAILKRVSATLSKSGGMPVPSSSEFDAKFDWLLTDAKAPAALVERLREHFRKRWSEAIAVEHDLANTAVTLHEALTRARQDAAVDADLASVNATRATDLIEHMRQRLGGRLDEQTAAKFPADIKNRLVDGELARLIGECPIDWRN